MSLSRAPLLYRIGRYALLLSAPGLLAIGLLFALGVLLGAPAVALCAVILLATAGLVTGPIADLARVCAAVDRLADNPDPGPPTGFGRLGPPAADLWLAFSKLAQQSDERVRVAEARVAAADAVIAAVPDPLMLLDRARRIVRTNAPAAALDGAGDGPRDLAAVLRHPAVLAAADAVLRGEPARIVEFGEVLPLERQLRARFARIEGASPDGAVAVLSLHDVTELKRAEQMRADFIANASHELRTPLATLTGFIETLGGLAREDEDARERFLAIMQAQAERMTRLVEDLLSLSRIELHEHLMPQDRVTLPALLRHLAEAMELRAGERGMRIVLRVPPNLPDVTGDRDQLVQVFQNLLDNAIKYGRAGGEIALEAGLVENSQHRGQDRLVAVAVRDQGEGIAREHLARLTERFYRVDAARSRAIGGTGLGLAIVKHILNRHRGLLEIDSEIGKGSVFTAFLRAGGNTAVPEPESVNDRHKTAIKPS